MILIADTFDAMTSERPFRQEMSTERALEALEEFAGSHFDPDLVSAMVDARDDPEISRIEMNNEPPGNYVGS